jgi:hypothetical protein
LIHCGELTVNARNALICATFFILFMAVRMETWRWPRTSGRTQGFSYRKTALDFHAG